MIKYKENVDVNGEKKSLIKGKKHKKKAILSSRTENINPTINSNHYEDVTYAEIDGRIDPNEQLYCFCNYISYGNMIKCDNHSVFKN